MNIFMPNQYEELATWLQVENNLEASLQLLRVLPPLHPLDPDLPDRNEWASDLLPVAVELVASLTALCDR